MMAQESWLPSSDSLSESAYLISHGVRPLALVGECLSEPFAMLRTATILEGVVGERSEIIAFVIDRGDGFASYGFARHQWSIDMLEWVHQHDIPDNVSHGILGLLLGYSSEGIERHGRQNGRRFDYSELLSS